MEIQQALIKDWFDKWQTDDFFHLPITNNFTHTSPFGVIQGKDNYLNLVATNKDKFLGYQFDIHDEIYTNNKACVRYTAMQNGFILEVSEWYFFIDGKIEAIIAHYHIGEIRQDKQLQ